MLHALTSATQTQPVDQTAVSNKPAAHAKPEASGAGKADTVQLSSAAQALQEASETSAQTAKEAGGGDVQAQRLLTKESAAHADVK